jgi:amidophosphoribosyltransferase
LWGSYVVASETCSFDFIGAKYMREIEPGEILQISLDGLQSTHLKGKKPPAHCIFEHIYFARPDSLVFGQNVYRVRKELGRRLARECPAEADFVMPIPDSGTIAALGYAEELKLPFEMGMVRNHYVGRTFIQPNQADRECFARIKLNPVRDLIKGKRLVIVEDSIVRGTTARMRVKTLREAGARRVSSALTFPIPPRSSPTATPWTTCGNSWALTASAT